MAKDPKVVSFLLKPEVQKILSALGIKLDLGKKFDIIGALGG